MANSAIGATGAIAALPSGVMIDYAATVAPAGWLMCDGSAISRTTYASLFATVTTLYGVGDGSTTFNLPDFRGRFARYMDNMGTAAGAASRDTGRVMGAAQTQTTAKNGLAVANNAANTGGESVSHSHQFSGSGAFLGTGGGVGTWGNVGSGTPIHYVNNSQNQSAGHTHSVTSNVTLGAGDAETRPINLACNRIIKV